MAFTNQILNLMAWTVTGIMSSATYLIDCLDENKINICGISVHWLYEKNLRFLNQLDNLYKNCHTVSGFELNRPSNRRFGKGGVDIKKCEIENLIDLHVRFGP